MNYVSMPSNGWGIIDKKLLDPSLVDLHLFLRSTKIMRKYEDHRLP